MSIRGDTLRELDELAARRWKAGLQTARNGEYKGNLANIVHALEHAPELVGTVQLDTFTRRMMLCRRPPWAREPFSPRAWVDADDGELLAWLQHAGIPATATTTVTEAVRVVATRHSLDSLAEYLNGLRWDGIERLSYWLTAYLGADGTPLVSAMGRKFLISAVARGLDPGCQVDHALILESERQGEGKTEAIRILGGEWTQEHLPDLHTKDAEAALAGVWIVEISELSALRRSEAEAIKSFLTRRVDRYRPAYGRHVISQTRRCVFIGSTNESRYLKDATGNRRFWPVIVGEVRLEQLRRDRDQLFAEAVVAYRADERWHFIDGDLQRQAELEQARRLDEDPWLQKIANYLGRRSETTTHSLLDLLDIPLGARAGGHGKRIGSIMRQLGWTPRVDQSGGEREVVWTPGSK